MALVLKDRVLETCAAPGTGTITLLGTVTGYQSFSTVGNGNTCYYAIADQSGSNWEVGIGTYSSGTLARTTVLSSSNAGALTNFSTGTQNVFLTYPSERSVNLSSAALTSGRVSYATTDGLLTDSAGLTWDGSFLTATSIKDTALTNGRVTYAGASGLLSDSANLTFDGATLTTSNGSGAAGLIVNSSANTPYLRFDQSNAAKFTIGESSIVGGGAGYYDFYAVASVGQRFWTGATQRMTILSTGNVGIGTSSPTNLLHLSSSGSTGQTITSVGTNVYSSISFSNTTTGYGYDIGFGGSASVAPNSFYIYGGSTASVKLVVNSSGNVGIGTSSPISSLANTATGITAASGLGTGTPAIQWNTTVQGYTAAFYNSGAANQFANGLLVKTIGTSNDLDAIVDFESGGVNRFKVTGAGNLGIGVTPSAWATYKALQGGSGSAIGFRNDGNPITLYTANLYVDGTNYRYISGSAFYGVLYAQDATQGQHTWQTAPSSTGIATLTQAMTLNASGNLGLGTSSPSARLGITTSTMNSQIVLGVSTSNANYGSISLNGNSADSGRLGLTGGGTGDGTLYIDVPATTGSYAFRQGATTLMTILSGGNVGINNVSPATKLDVDGTGYFRNLLYVSGLYGITSDAPAPLIFGINGTEKMRLDASFNLIVGNSSALTQVARATFVNSGGNAVVALCGNGTTAYQSTNTSGTSAYYAAIFSNNGNSFSTCGTIIVSGSTTTYATTSSSASGAQLNASGIEFPSTQVASANANTLDDYEEGTWTPAGGSLTNNATATYTKVGRLVYANFDISFPVGGAATQAQISGMPFTALTPGGGGSIGFTSYIVPVTINMERGTTYFTFCTYGGGTVTFANVNGERFIGTLVYTT
jgi:hypothetical protein